MSSNDEQPKTPTRSLPGFLRRSLRMNYSDDQEEKEESSDTVWKEAEAPTNGDTNNNNNQDDGDDSEEFKTRPASPPTVTRKDMEETKSETKEETTSRNFEAPRPSPPRQTLERTISYKDAMFEKAINADVVSMSDLRKLGWNGIPVRL